MTACPRLRIAGLLLAIFVVLPSTGNGQVPDRPPTTGDAIQPDPAWKPLGKSLWFDPKEKRLVIRTKVVLRDGALEHFLCLKGTKEHESILATDAPPRLIHTGLILTGAEPGHPVRFVPKFEPPTGTTLALEVEWKQDGRVRRVDARQWVRDVKTKKALVESWVFGGSELYQDPISKKMMYAADEGDLITVANFGSAILDLPFASSSDNADRMFLAETELIPAVGTEVLLSFKPRREDKPKGKKPEK